MFRLRDFIIFLSGITFIHTISHIILPYYVALPWALSFMTLTQTTNYWIIAISALLTIILIWWASKLPR